MSETPQRPSIATLIDWLEGRLDADETATVEQAVRLGDDTVDATVQWLRRFIVAAESVPLSDSPPLVTQRLLQHFEKWARSRAILDSPPHEVRALLVFDSRQDLVGAGARGGADVGDAVHLAFASDAADLLLDVRYLGSGRVRIDGQVLTTGSSSAPVFEAVATGPSFTQRTIDGDELGRFFFGEVPETVTELHASNGEVRIVAPLRLGGG